VNAMTALSVLAFFMYLRQSNTLEKERVHKKEALQAERDLLEVQVTARTAQLTELAQHLQTAREDERSRLARDLHDELGALLTAAKLDVARLKSRITIHTPDITERLVHLNATLNEGIALKRRIIEDLRPSSLSNLGLLAALEILGREFAERSGVQVVSDLAPVSLKPSGELTVYRLVQEALTNVAKYAQARQVVVTLKARGALAEVDVHDNGTGFDTRIAKPSSHGLLGMRYRVEAEGGRMAIQSTPGAGTRIQATLPQV
jgi:signal transduction histidine kinase